LLNIKGTNLKTINDILLFLTSMCVKMYYVNTKYVVKKTTSNQFIFVAEYLSLQVNRVYINVYI